MYICICNCITEHQVQQAINMGARSVRDLNRSLSVGSECGKCTRAARQIIEREHNNRTPTQNTPA